MTSQGDMKNTFICLTVMIVREGGHLNAFGVLVARKDASKLCAVELKRPKASRTRLTT